MPRLTWDNYFMLIAKAVAQRSEDPNTKHGAVLVDNRNRIVGTGYNGPPPRIDIAWDDSKYDWVVHAEENAMLHTNQDGCTMYVTGVPCTNCLVRMAARRIKRVVHGDTKSRSECRETSRSFAKTLGIDLVDFFAS